MTLEAHSPLLLDRTDIESDTGSQLGAHHRAATEAGPGVPVPTWTVGPAAREARLIHDLVAEQAACRPDAVALSLGDTTATYQRLHDVADMFAGKLRAHGVRPGEVVGVLMHRSPRMVVALLAILRAGGAYLGLDPDDPQPRQVRLLQDAGVRFLVSDLEEDLPPDVQVLTPETPVAASDPGAPQQAPDSLAYVSYTSGTTGEPKGVAVPHRAVSRLVHGPRWLEIRPDDVFLQLAPIAFDASTLEIWAPLANGCRLAMVPPGPVDLDQVARTIVTEKVTVLWLTAGLFQQMVSSQLTAFAGVRHVIAGGDVVSPGHVNILLAAHPGLTFTNGYGPTENTTFTTSWTTAQAPAPDAPIPVGRPIDGTSVAVLDDDLQPVPVGDRGELYAWGAGLADGYLNRPGATAERFVPCEFATEPGQRMYRTGDLARWLPNGELEFLGRADQQLKIQGYRIELGAIEAELMKDPDVSLAAVIAQPEHTGGKRLLAYVLPTGGDHTDPDLGARLRARLLGTLPAHQVPWAILPVPDLPLDRNGKVDRRALPAAGRVARNVWNEFVPPRTPMEKALAEVWGSLLGVEPIGVEDDFFELGGHSLLAVDLIDRIRREFGVNMQARTLYLEPTVAELAITIEGTA